MKRWIPWVLLVPIGAWSVWLLKEHAALRGSVGPLQDQVKEARARPVLPPLPPANPLLDLDRARKEREEFQKLQVEVQQLQSQKSDLNQRAQKLAAQLQNYGGDSTVRNLQTFRSPAEVNAESQNDVRVLAEIGQTFILFAKQHNGQLPRGFADVQAMAPDLRKYNLERYEVIGEGNLNTLPNLSQVPVVRTRELDAAGRRVYLFADGTVTTQQETP